MAIYASSVCQSWGRVMGWVVAKITDAERILLEKLDAYLTHLGTFKQSKPESVAVTAATHRALQKRLSKEKGDPVNEYKGFRLRVQQ